MKQLFNASLLVNYYTELAEVVKVSAGKQSRRLKMITKIAR
jgi:hypothetical protein